MFTLYILAMQIHIIDTQKVINIVHIRKKCTIFTTFLQISAKFHTRWHLAIIE